MDPATAPTLPSKVRAPVSVNPADVDAMLALIPKHAAEKIFPVEQMKDETREEALEMVAEYCLNIDGKRRHDVWTTLSSKLNEHFAGLMLQPNDVRKFCVRHVLPNIVVARSYIARAIVERGLSFDTLGSTLDVREKLEQSFSKAVDSLNEIREDGNGKLVATGTRADELAALGKAILAANKMAAEELERYGIVPEAKKAPAVGVNLNFNIANGMARLAGRPAQPVDAVFTPKPAEGAEPSTGSEV